MFAALVALPLAASAEEPIVQLPATPEPKAGPTMTSAHEFCGAPLGKAEELIERYSKDPALKQVYTSNDYVAFADDAKNPTLMYTFTTKSHEAYPAAVCRKPEREGDKLVIKMAVVCDGKADPCAKLKNDFNVMTAVMQAEVDNKIKDEKK
jgi:hypothetical protein